MRISLSRAEAGKLGGIIGGELSKRRKEERIKKYNEDPKLCNYCQKSLIYGKRRNKYCNHSCSAIFNNVGHKKHGEYANKKCINCDKITKNPKFCSSICQQNYYRKQRWKKIEETGCLINPPTDKKYLIYIRGNKCEICEITEWLKKPILLLLDHIDGNSDDNRLGNVRLICANCDTMLPTYKGKNLGNGRYSRKNSKRCVRRRQRYANGQSY